MAIVQISKIINRTGLASDLPQLEPGEIGYATDVRKIYIGNDPAQFPPTGTSTTSQTEILTELSTLSFSKINGSQYSNVNFNNLQVGQLVIVKNIASSQTLEIVNAGGNALVPSATNLYANARIHLGHVDYVKLGGGTNGYVLQTDGTGNLTWAAFQTGTIVQGLPGGANAQLQFNDGGTNFGGSPFLVFNKVNGNLTLTGNLTATRVSGTLSGSYNGTIGATTPNTAVFTSTVTNVNANVNGNLRATNAFFTTANVGNATGVTLTLASTANVSNLRVVNRVTSNLIPTPDGVFNLGIAAQKWNELYLSSNAYIGNYSIKANATLLSINSANVNFNSGNGNITVGNVLASNLTGTIRTASQPNITSVGNLTSLTVTGKLTLTDPSNVYIDGGANGFVLTTDGSGNLSWQAVPPAVAIAGGNVTEIQFNNNGQISGNIGLRFDSVSQTLYAPDVIASGNVSISNVSKLAIPGGINGQFLRTNGSGVLSWATPSGSGGSTPGGPNTSVQFNASGVLGGSASFTYSSTTQTLNVTRIAGSLTTAAQPNITSVGVLTNLIVSGNITSSNANLGNSTTSNYFLGSGAYLTNINGSNVSEVPNANFATYSTYATSATTAGSVTTASQPNITSVGTMTGITVTGITSLGTISNVKINGGVAGQFITTDGLGNLSWASSTGVPSGSAGTIQFTDGTNFSGSANLTFNNLTNTLSVDYITGVFSSAASSQPNITSVGTLTSLGVTGNITSGNANLGNLVSANFFSGSGNNLSNIQASNITGAVANANYAAYAGDVISASQPNITSVGTLVSLDVTGNIGTLGNLNVTNEVTANSFSGIGSGLSQLTAGNITGTVANANYSAYAGYVTGAAQANITSVGNLTTLTIRPTTVNNSTDMLKLVGNSTAKSLYMTGTNTYSMISSKANRTGYGVTMWDGSVISANYPGTTNPIKPGGGTVPFVGTSFHLQNLANASNIDHVAMFKTDSVQYPSGFGFIPVTTFTVNMGANADSAIGDAYFRNMFIGDVVIKDTSNVDETSWHTASDWILMGGGNGLYIYNTTTQSTYELSKVDVTADAGNGVVPTPIGLNPNV